MRKLALIVAMLFAGCSGKGIITLENYPHAVVICGEAITINYGHYHDKEVKELMTLADRVCPK